MNEITKIHLGRQAFTISVDAYKLLRDYLQAIGRHAGGKEVVEEVELRMAELLAERSIKGDKVILAKDVEYLKEQLGKPGDFSDEDDKGDPDDEDTPGAKRLFRDTEHAMLAGVCAGLGRYLGVDPVWIRLLFALLIFAGFSSILVYIVLWLIVPEAKTNSERLQMQGKQVTVDALKNVVERADVKGAAKRATNVVGKVVNASLKVVLGTVGVGLMLGAVAALLGLTTASIYWTLNRDIVPENIFPVGGAEVALVFIWFLFAAVISLFLLFGGLAMVKRKWSLPGWALGSMVAVALVSLAAGSALTADAAPKVRDRYEAAQHTYVRDVPAFDKLNLLGNMEVDVNYKESSETHVTVRYWGTVDLSKLKTSEKDGVLTVDSRELADETRCEKFCIFHSPILEVNIYGPKLKAVTTDMDGISFSLPPVRNQSLVVKSENSSGGIQLPQIIADRISLKRQSDGSWAMDFTGTYSHPFNQEFFTSGDDMATLLNAQDVTVEFSEACLAGDGTSQLYTDGNFKKLTVNGKTFTSLVDLKAAQSNQPNFYNCVYVDPSLYQQLVGDDVEAEVQGSSDSL